VFLLRRAAEWAFTVVLMLAALLLAYHALTAFWPRP